jgi:hypothetical protein
LIAAAVTESSTVSGAGIASRGTVQARRSSGPELAPEPSRGTHQGRTLDRARPLSRTECLSAGREEQGWYRGRCPSLRRDGIFCSRAPCSAQRKQGDHAGHRPAPQFSVSRLGVRAPGRGPQPASPRTSTRSALGRHPATPPLTRPRSPHSHPESGGQVQRTAGSPAMPCVRVRWIETGDVSIPAKSEPMTTANTERGRTPAPPSRGGAVAGEQ